jgi:hypothetical protein
MIAHQEPLPVQEFFFPYPVDYIVGGAIRTPAPLRPRHRDKYRLVCLSRFQSRDPMGLTGSRASSL